jgi:hypothetical protein
MKCEADIVVGEYGEGLAAEIAISLATVREGLSAVEQSSSSEAYGPIRKDVQLAAVVFPD